MLESIWAQLKISLPLFSSLSLLLSSIQRRESDERKRLYVAGKGSRRRRGRAVLTGQAVQELLALRRFQVGRVLQEARAALVRQGFQVDQGRQADLVLRGFQAVPAGQEW
uniref:Uncharacterized protein n=1 Tax=Globodera rostochiensis TaxID=31243 RepID=A0A914H2D3_GLORO